MVLTKNEVYMIFLKNGVIDQFMAAKADQNIIPATRAMLINETTAFDFAVPEVRAMLEQLIPIIGQKSYDEIIAAAISDIQIVPEEEIVYGQPYNARIANGIWIAELDLCNNTTGTITTVKLEYDDLPSEAEIEEMSKLAIVKLKEAK